MALIVVAGTENGSGSSPTTVAVVDASNPAAATVTMLQGPEIGSTGARVAIDNGLLAVGAVLTGTVSSSMSPLRARPLRVAASIRRLPVSAPWRFAVRFNRRRRMDELERRPREARRWLGLAAVGRQHSDDLAAREYGHGRKPASDLVDCVPQRHARDRGRTDQRPDFPDRLHESHDPGAVTPPRTHSSRQSDQLTPTPRRSRSPQAMAAVARSDASTPAS